MRTQRLIGPPSGVARMPELADLIDDLGTPAFPASLFRSTFGWARADHLTAFAFTSDCKPRMIFAETVGNTPLAREVADKYCRDYWRHDLANLVQPDTTTSEARTGWILQTRAGEIAHSDYRRYCYTAISLDDRISLSETRGDRTLRMNFYRTKGRPFTDEDTARIADMAHLLLALVRRHADHGAASQQNSLAHYRERLTAVAPSLTPRENEVCAAIILGLTSEGIALELGVSLNTVLTYKKRAYARLAISSQNQLMRLILN